jgi:hypothetical protein
LLTQQPGYYSWYQEGNLMTKQTMADFLDNAGISISNAGKGPLPEDRRRKRAVNAFIGALVRRGFVEVIPGSAVYESNGRKVDTNLTHDGEVIIDDEYKLSVGAGAITEFDSYMGW